MIYRKKGFSLVEVILTLLVLGILSAVVIPRFGGNNFLGEFGLKGISSQIASDIRLTRQLAITQSDHYLIKFNCAQKEYNIYKASALPENAIQESKKLPSNVSCSGTTQFDFYPIGNCIFSGSGLVLSSGGKQRSVTVEPPSGAVLIEE